MVQSEGGVVFVVCFKPLGGDLEVLSMPGVVIVVGSSE